MRCVRLAVDYDLADIAAVIQANGVPLSKLPSTILVAKEEGQLIGLLGLDWSTGCVQAGPLLLAPAHDAKKWVILRLIEAAEDFLAGSGITHYIFCTPADNAPLRRIVEKAGAAPYAEESGMAWYIREVNRYGQS